MPEKRLYRSRTDKIVAGVCGGFAKYFDIDPVIIRLFWVATFFLAGAGVLLYIVAWIIMPEEPLRKKENVFNEEEEHVKDKTGEDYKEEAHDADEEYVRTEFNEKNSTYEQRERKSRSHEQEKKSKLVIGVGILFVGVAFLLNRAFTWNISWSVVFGIFLIIAGAAILYKFFRDENK